VAKGFGVIRARPLLVVLLLLVVLGPRLEPHGHHCIKEEAACASCRVAATPSATPAGSGDIEGFDPEQTLAALPVLEARRPAPPTIVNTPLRAPPIFTICV
jgi:hypothetical protein